MYILAKVANIPGNSGGGWGRGGTLRSTLCAIMKTTENDNIKERKNEREEYLCNPSVLFANIRKKFFYLIEYTACNPRAS